MGNRWGNGGHSGWLYFLGSKITADGESSHKTKTHLLLVRNALTNIDSILKSKGLYSYSSGFSSSHVWMWEIDHKERWALKNCCFWIVVLEETFESSLNCKEIKPASPKGNQSWLFIGRTDAEAEAPILWPPGLKNWITGKYSNTGKDWRQEEKVITGRNCWMTSPTWWPWVCASSRSWFWTENPGLLQSMGSQRVGHDWVTELNS